MQKKSLQEQVHKVLPEAVKEERSHNESVFLRTVIKKEVYDRLKALAQLYSTGQGNWDFGVAIQVLLDFYDESRLGLQSDKLDMIIGLLNNGPGEEPPKEEEFVELLGGDKISKKG